MFNLVANIAAYPEFLPWCSEAEVLSVDGNEVQARLGAKKGPLGYTFSTRNINESPDRILLELLDGPFKALSGTWTFAGNADGCIVSLSLDFEFSNRLLSGALSKVFAPTMDAMVDAFQQRAYQIYGS